MARIAGRNGALFAGITSGGTAEPIAYLTQWTLDASSDRTDVTAFGDTAKAYVQGLPDAQGTFSGWYDSASAQLYTAAVDGVARKTYLYPDRTTPSVYFFGTCFYDFSIDTSVDGAVSISGSWASATSMSKVG